MMIFACKCLNVVVECEPQEFRDIVDKNSLQLSHVETQDMFFSQELRQVLRLQKVIKVLPKLVDTRDVGLWTVSQCMNCNLHTHAVHKENKVGHVLMTSKLLNASEIEKLKKSEHFSRVYNIVISTINLEDQKQSDLQLMPSPELDSLRKQMDQCIQQATTATEERIRLYTEQQELALEEYKEKAKRDYRALIRSIAKHKLAPPLMAEKVSQQPPPSTKTPKLLEANDISDNTKVPDFKDKKVQPQSKLVLTMAESPKMSTLAQNLMSRNSTVDAECLFQLEDMENSNENAFSSDEGESSASDAEESGIAIKSGYQQRANNAKYYHLAQSLPMDIPNYMSAFKNADDFDDDLNQPEETTDIAASMRALAKSVHGETVFGDLPRPSFRTHI